MSASEVIEWGVALAATVGDLAPLPAEDAVELVRENHRLREGQRDLHDSTLRILDALGIDSDAFEDDGWADLACERIAELKAGEVRTEWGARREGHPGVVNAPFTTEGVVREFVRMWPEHNYIVVSHVVRTTTGPWTDAATHLDGDNS